MKTFSQFINEVIIGGLANYRNRPLVDGGGSTDNKFGGGPSLEDLTGVKLPPDEVIAAGMMKTNSMPPAYKAAPKTSSPRLQSEPFEKGMDKSIPSVSNKLYSDKIGGSSYASGSTEKAYNLRGVRSSMELEDIKSSGYMNPKPGKNNTKYFTHTDNPRDIEGYHATVRVPSSKTPAGKAVSSSDVELYNRSSKSWEKLVK